MENSIRLSVIVAALALATPGGATYAEVWTDASGVDSRWNNAGNWDTDVPNNNSETAIFQTKGALNNPTWIPGDPNVIVKGIQFEDGGWNIDSSKFIEVHSTGIDFNSGSGTVTIQANGDIKLKNNQTWTVAAGNTLIVNKDVRLDDSSNRTMTKNGDGTLVINRFDPNSANSHKVTVSAGTMRVKNGSTVKGAFTVNAGGALAGSFSLSSDASLDINGVLSPSPDDSNDGVGTITSNRAVNINAGGVFAADLDAAGVSDLLEVGDGKTLTLDAASVLDLNDLGGAFDGSTYTIATYGAGFLTGTFGTVNGLGGGYQVIYGSEAITLELIPEPASLALLMVGGLLAVGGRRGRFVA